MNPIVPATRMVISHRAMNARVRMRHGAGLADDVLHVLAQSERIKRLGDVAGGAEAEAALNLGLLRLGGQEDDGNGGGRGVGLEPAAGLGAVELRHHPVEQDDVGRLAA